jgi:hypothetical protein
LSRIIARASSYGYSRTPVCLYLKDIEKIQYG